jgi:hypothetical protein
VSEFQSRRELREAERQGLVPKPEQVFDLPTGQIKLPENADQVNTDSLDLPAASEMLTRKRIREMERQGLLDPLTGALAVAPASTETPVGQTRTYDEVLAETEEPITSSISAVAQTAEGEAYTKPVVSNPPAAPVSSTPVASESRPVASVPASFATESVPATDIFHNMAVDLNSKRPRVGLIIGLIMVVLVGASAAAYMLGIFK